MSFFDVYLPDAVPGYPCVSIPRFSTTISVTAGGKENRNQNWEHPLHKFTLPRGVRDWATVEALKKRWYNFGGPAQTFPWRDPLDFASVDLLAPNEDEADVTARISRADQLLGTGDGAKRAFQLRKAYTITDNAAVDHTYYRPIYLPVDGSVLVEVDGKAFDDPAQTGGAYGVDVDRDTGVITFDRAVGNGLTVKAGFLFDVEVRFEQDDTFEQVLQSFMAGGFSDLTLTEVRPC